MALCTLRQICPIVHPIESRPLGPCSIKMSSGCFFSFLSFFFDLCSLSPGLEFFIFSSSPKETPSLFWAFFLLEIELNCESNWLQQVFSLADSIRIEGTLHLNNPIVLSPVGASFMAIKQFCRPPECSRQTVCQCSCYKRSKRPLGFKALEILQVYSNKMLA